jgi:hypothetical protein
MPRLMLIAVFALAVVGFGSSSTAARHGRSTYAPPPSPPADLYCLQGRTWGYPGNCQFGSYEQCTATAWGTEAYCGINPVWAFRGWRQE